MNYPAVLSSKQMLTQDLLTIQSMGVPSPYLMELAANAVRVGFQSCVQPLDKIAVICGTGNNGGDGFAVARQLKIQGFDVECFHIGQPKTPDALHHQKIMQGAGLQSNSVEHFDPNKFKWVVDALLGTGLNQAVKPNLQSVVHKINTVKNVISIDIPSGICGDTGQGWNCHVTAQKTVTFQFAKRGHYMAEGIRATGELLIADIGIAPVDMRDSCWYRRKPQKPTAPYKLTDHYSHKGSQGKVVVAGSAPGTIGAGLFCAKAAQNVGSGLVSILAPKNSIPILQSKAPEIMSFSIDKSFDADTLVVGPGCSEDSVIQKHLKQLVKRHSKAVVVDAEGLRMFRDWSDLIETLQPENLARDCILTPHPGELKVLIQLFQCSNSGNYEDMWRELNQNGITLLAKDAYTILYSPDSQPLVLGKPNSQLARGGSGDILAGIIASFLAKGLKVVDAVCLAFDWLNEASSPSNLIDAHFELSEGGPTSLLLTSLNRLRLELSKTSG